MNNISPALLALPLDATIGAHSVTIRVYLRLLSILDFVKPRPVKVWAVAEDLCVKDETVSRALNILIERGYVNDHGRGANKVRECTLAWSLPHEFGSHTPSERTTPTG